ncbi:MAG TPA: SIS domain-containing protein [Streptosporangiaceae bacterium]|nr:SIS domain-containing protein [Streptosporangiaceae bacterium]
MTDPPERPGEAGTASRAVAAFGRRIGPGRELADRAGEIANAAHAMAVRFHQGGKLVVFGIGGAAADAQHVAVEFVHPVIVGKRALPAISLTSDAATVTGVAAHEGLASVFSHQIRYLGEPADIALGIALEENCPSVLAGLRAGSDLGMLTVALVAGTGTGSAVAGERLDHLLAAGSADPRIVKEIHVSTYHLLWELVHVFFEQPGVLGPGVVT